MKMGKGVGRVGALLCEGLGWKARPRGCVGNPGESWPSRPPAPAWLCWENGPYAGKLPL